MVTPPSKAHFDATDEAPTARKRPSGKIDIEGLGAVLTIAFAMYGRTRPAPIRNIPGVQDAWLFAPMELAPVSEPLAKIIGELPAKYSNLLNRVMAPAQLLMGVVAVMQEGNEREKRAINEFAAFLKSNPEAASSWERANLGNATKGGDSGGARNSSGPANENLPARDPGLPGFGQG